MITHDKLTDLTVSFTHPDTGRRVEVTLVGNVDASIRITPKIIEGEEFEMYDGLVRWRNPDTIDHMVLTLGGTSDNCEIRFPEAPRNV